MPPRRRDPAAAQAATTPPDTYASIWFELSEAQRKAILSAIGNTDPTADPEIPVGEPTPAVRETMQALRRVLLDETTAPRPALPEQRSVPRHQDPPSRDATATAWGWRPEQNALVAASFDPALIVGGSAPDRGSLVCQRVTVPAGTTIRSVLLDVVSPGGDLTDGDANLAAVYEADGTRAGVTDDQSTSWSNAGLHRVDLIQQIPAQDEARSVWVAFITDGDLLPGFAVPWISRSARPNLGLPSPGPQRAGKITGQTTCPDTITPTDMQACMQYWVGLA